MGVWFSGILERSNGKLTGITGAILAPIRDKAGNPLTGKSAADAEGIEVVGNQAILTFERNHRVEAHDIDLEHFSGSVVPLQSGVDRLKLRSNKGLEAIVFIPPVPARPGSSASAGDARFLLFSERSLNIGGNIRAFILRKGKLQEFAVKRQNSYDITSADIGPDGKLYLLERHYALTDGVSFRIRRFDLASVKPRATIRGETLLTADTSYQIDNLEGMSIRSGSRGEPILTLISDDNLSLLQRTLLLEFRVVE